MTPEQDSQNRDERHGEKQQEKEQEKKREKGQGLDEKYRRNPLGFVAWGLVIIWLGVTLLLENAGAFNEGPNHDDHQWAFFAWGVGVIFLAEAFLRVAVPRWRRSVSGSFIWGAVVLGVGFGLWYDKWEVIGPIIIIAVGVGILAGRLVPRR